MNEYTKLGTYFKFMRQRTKHIAVISWRKCEMKILKLLVIPALLITLQLGLPSTLQSSADPRQTTYTSSVFELTEFNASEIDNKIHVESNNHGVPLLGVVIEDKGIPLLDAVIEDTGIPLLDVMLNDDGSHFAYSTNK